MSVTAEQAIRNYTAGVWAIDPIHSEIGFSVRHVMVSRVRGKFTKFSGMIVLGESPFDSSVTASVEMGSVDTGNTERDRELRSPVFFDADTYPTMSFRSTGVRSDGEDYIVDGDLTLKAVTKSISLHLEVGGFGLDAQGQTRAGFTVTGMLNRRDFGVDFNAVLEAGGVVVADRVDLQLEIEAVLST